MKGKRTPQCAGGVWHVGTRLVHAETEATKGRVTRRVARRCIFFLLWRFLAFGFVKGGGVYGWVIYGFFLYN